jgi:hypothetical protein
VKEKAPKWEMEMAASQNAGKNKYSNLRRWCIWHKIGFIFQCQLFIQYFWLNIIPKSQYIYPTSGFMYCYIVSQIYRRKAASSLPENWILPIKIRMGTLSFTTTLEYHHCLKILSG